jgi:hypothetical protein
MPLPNHPTLIRRSLQSGLKRLGSDGPILVALLCAYTHRCGRSSCKDATVDTGAGNRGDRDRRLRLHVLP